MLPRLQCAGRLDADSTGLMIWSTSEQIVRHIIGASTSVEKEYIVRVRGAEAPRHHLKELFEVSGAKLEVARGRRRGNSGGTTDASGAAAGDDRPYRKRTHWWSARGRQRA